MHDVVASAFRDELEKLSNFKLSLPKVGKAPTLLGGPAVGNVSTPQPKMPKAMGSASIPKMSKPKGVTIKAPRARSGPKP
jgi:hypothetical protein